MELEGVLLKYGPAVFLSGGEHSAGWRQRGGTGHAARHPKFAGVKRKQRRIRLENKIKARALAEKVTQLSSRFPTSFCQSA